MIVLIGDLRLGLISMVPNLFPVIFILGFMGWMDIPLDASNVVIGSVIIGLAYYLASEMLANSGQVFNFDPAVIAWLPSVALAVVTAFALNRIR